MPKILGRFLSVLLLSVALSGCNQAFHDAMQRGDDYAAVGDWDRAADAYQEALGHDPEDEDAQIKFRQARRQQARVRVARGIALLESGNARDALLPFFDATKLDPMSVDARRGFYQAKQVVIAQGHNALDAGRFKEAFSLARALLDIEPTNPNGLELEATAKTKIAQAAFERGQAAEQANQLGLALVDYGEAMEFQPGHEQAFAKSAEIRRRIREEITYYVALKNFDGDETADDLGADVNASMLANGLDPLLPLRVVDSLPKPGKGMKAQGMRLGGVFRGYGYNKSSSRSSRTCDYVCGKELVSNPAYTTAEAAMRNSQSALGSAEGRLSAAQAAVGPAERARDSAKSSADLAKTEADRAEQDLQSCRARTSSQAGACAAEEQRRTRAQEDQTRASSEASRTESAYQSARSEVMSAESNLASARSDAASKKSIFEGTPAKVEVDKHCSHSYEVETVVVSGEIECQLRGEGLYDTDAVLAQPVQGRVSRSDQTFPAQSGVCSEVASGDPLTIPSPGDVKGLVLASAVASTQAAILGVFDRYRQGYFVRARAASADNRGDEAADSYVRFLSTLNKEERSGPQAQEAIAALVAMRQVDEAGVGIGVFGPHP